jgi:hypothetical protein
VVAENSVSTFLVVASFLSSKGGQIVLSRSSPQESKIEQLIVESTFQSLSTSLYQLIVELSSLSNTHHLPIDC